MDGEYTYEATSRSVTTGRGELHYHEAGDGPPLLLLHGSGPGASGWANFRDNLPAFAARFRTLILDFPGFGSSYTTQGNPFPAALDAVVDFMDQLGVERASVVGNSMGGGVGAQLAARQPSRVDRLVTMGGVGIALFSPMPSEGIKLLVDFVEEPTRARLLTWMESMVFDPAILTDEFVDLRWRSASDPAALESIRRMYNRQMLAGLRDVIYSPASTDYLLDIRCPTLITWGRDDRVTPLDGALLPLRMIRHCELHTFPNCGHWAMIERKNEFESAVIAFLLAGGDHLS